MGLSLEQRQIERAGGIDLVIAPRDWTAARVVVAVSVVRRRGRGRTVDPKRSAANDVNAVKPSTSRATRCSKGSRPVSST